MNLIQSLNYSNIQLLNKFKNNYLNKSLLHTSSVVLMENSTNSYLNSVNSTTTETVYSNVTGVYEFSLRTIQENIRREREQILGNNDKSFDMSNSTNSSFSESFPSLVGSDGVALDWNIEGSDALIEAFARFTSNYPDLANGATYNDLLKYYLTKRLNGDFSIFDMHNYLRNFSPSLNTSKTSSIENTSSNSLDVIGLNNWPFGEMGQITVNDLATNIANR